MINSDPARAGTEATAPDPFGTQALRSRVLDAWSASAARFREDANAEDDLVRGGYRDRVVVELAQNAADAATRAGVPGRLLLRLADDGAPGGGILTAANTGSPLDAPGVESLCTLRASSKRDGSTAGRFGVGFAAVLALTDEPRIASRTGAVRWDAAGARGLAEQVPGVRDELARRGGQLPVLRLPFPGSGSPPDGYDTVVELPLRDPAAGALADRLLGEVDDALLLALPALAEIVVEVGGRRRVVAGADDWQVVRRHGRLHAHLLADRPVEERDRPHWSVTWARPRRQDRQVPAVLHAPTPTDEPLDLPALLIASFPLDPTRRHVAPGPLTDALVEECARAYVDLVLACDDLGDRLALVPGPVAAGRLDGQVRRAVTDALGTSPWLTTVEGHPVAPRDAVAVAGATDEVLAACADAVGGLVRDHPALAGLGAQRLVLADLVDILGELDRPARWWRGVYAALAAGPLESNALGALPVPLVDGRVVRGPRGALLPADVLTADVAALGLRLVHPDAAHPVLARLGAETSTPRSLLDRPEVRAAVEDAWETDPPEGPDALSTAVLGLVDAAGVVPGELPWLASLPLRDADGQLAAADELALPGSLLARLAEPGSLGEVDPDLARLWGPDVLRAVGVLAEPTVVEVHDVLLDPAAVDLADRSEHSSGTELPDLEDYLASVAAGLDRPGSAAVVRGIRELDVVADGSWPALLAAVAAEPALREAMLDPVVVDTGGSGGLLVPSHAAWWVRTHGLLGGRPPTHWRLAAAEEIDGLYDVLDPPRDVPSDVLAAMGVRVSLAALLAEPGGPDELLDRLGDRSRTVPERVTTAAYVALAGVPPDRVDPPRAVRVAPDLVVRAAEAVVLAAPHHLQVSWPVPPLVVPLGVAEELAGVLDVALTSQALASARVDGAGTRQPVPAEARGLLPSAPGEWWEHDELVVGGDPVSWWVEDDGRVHASTLDGLAWGLAWAARHWSRRWAVSAVLADPDRLPELMAELRLDDVP